MLKTLNNNESLACIDLRGNKGYADNPGVQQTLAQFLQRNLTIGLQKNARFNSNWIIKEQIFLKDENGEEILDGVSAILAEKLHRSVAKQKAADIKSANEPDFEASSLTGGNLDLGQLDVSSVKLLPGPLPSKAEPAKKL